MKILTDKYLSNFKKSNNDLLINIEKFKMDSKELNFDYLTQASSVYSSNIEGNTIDLNSFMNLKMNKQVTKDSEEIENLIKAYNFAQTNNLNEKNLLIVHDILSETLLIKSRRGKYRDDKVGVFGKEGLIYLAIEAEFLKEKMNELFVDIEELLTQDLTSLEVFYYASLIHLKFVHLHPFFDGNGRCARLLEKWFISKKIGHDFWKLSSEEYYKNNIGLYYKNIDLGVNYYELNYDNCLSFLLMGPESIKK